MVLMPSLSAGPFATRLAVVLPPERPELRSDIATHAPGLCPVSSQHRRLRQPHLLGSDVSFTQASSARILSIEERCEAFFIAGLLLNSRLLECYMSLSQHALKVL